MERIEETLFSMLAAHTGLAMAATDIDGNFTLFTPALYEMLGVGAPTRDSRGQITGALCLVQDVTLEHAATRRQAELRDRLVRTLNHELRTPLATAVGHGELLEDLGDALPAVARSSVSALIEAHGRLTTLSEMISELVDLESAGDLRLGDVDLGELLAHTVAAQGEHDRDVRMEYAGPDHLQVIADPDQLRRAVSALLDNALTYAPTGTTVTVAMDAGEHHAAVCVSDRGSGIPADDRARLLEPFEVGEHELQPVSPRGLGLALAQVIAQAHGGSIELLDHEPIGLRARITLPLRASRAS